MTNHVYQGLVAKDSDSDKILPVIRDYLIIKIGGINVDKKRNYKKRAPRKPYGKWTCIVEQVGKDKLNEIFSRTGMYTASIEISQILGEEVTPWVTRYIRNRLKEECNG
jgi:hypothetical protein